MTPITIRSHVELPAGLDNMIHKKLDQRLADARTLVERGTVRFDDINGPRGGVDTVCRIKLVLKRRPSIIAEERAGNPRTAFHRALPVAMRALDRTRGKHGLRGNPRGAGLAKASPKRPAKRATRTGRAPLGEIIGRRVGRGPEALERALKRPEKRRRDAYVDTAEPGVSASDRRAGGRYTARRNTLASTSRATATLEDSRTKPSRKSTRRSANRGKPSQMKERTALAQSVTPSARAARARARAR